MSGGEQASLCRAFKEPRPGLPGGTQTGLCSLSRQQRACSVLRSGVLRVHIRSPLPPWTLEPGKVEGVPTQCPEACYSEKLKAEL